MALEKNEINNVNEQLREMTMNYLNSHPSLTINGLAKRSGIPATTLRRILNVETKSELAPHTVLSLVSYLLREKKISKLLSMVEGPIGELLKKCFDQYVFDESSDHQLENDLNELFKDKLVYLIYKMAANKQGTSLQEIKDNFGLLGLRKTEELLAANKFYLDEKQRVHAKLKNFSVELKRAHELTHALVDQYKPEDVNKGLNLFYSLSEGLNEAGIKEVKRIQLEAVKKVFEVMNKEQFVGDLPYFSIFLSDTIGMTPEVTKEKEVLQ